MAADIHDPGTISAFAGGMLSFLSPCVLPLVPGYLSLVSGLSAAELSEGHRSNMRRVVVSTLLFVAGFTAVFVALGATASGLGETLRQHQPHDGGHAAMTATSAVSCVALEGRCHQARDGSRQLLPLGPFRGELLSTRGRQAIHPHALIVLRHVPLGGDGALALEAVQRGIQRAGVHLQHIARARANHLRDAVPVSRTPAQCLEDDQIECALEQLDARESCLFPGHSVTSTCM